jgi:predicted Zn-dependent protease
MRRVLLALLAIAAPAAAQTTPVPGLPPPRILVVPFETPGHDGRAYWLGEGVALLIADDINARGLGAITRTSRERAYEQLHLPASAVLSRATVIKVGEIVGASQVIAGSVSLDGDTFTIRARPIRIDVGRAEAEIVERGNLPELFTIVQRAARRLLPGGSQAAPAPPPSLQAFEQFVKGLLAEQPASQAEFLEAALKLDANYDRPRLALWEVRTAQGDHAAALAAVRGVDAKARWARRARLLAALSMTELKQFDEAFATLQALNDAQPSAAVFNNLGIVQIRRNAADTGRPTYYLTKAAELEPDDPDILFNLGYAYALDRDPQGAIYWLREALRRNPADGDAHVVLAAALDSSGSTVEAARERELAQQLTSRHAEAVAGADRLPRGLERVRQDLDPARGSLIDRAITSTAQRDQLELAQFHLERGRRLYELEQDREAATELRRAVFLSPYEAEAQLLLGRIHLRGGRPQDAVAALKISIWSRDTAAAQLALADAYLRLKDPASARTHVQKALALDPKSAEAEALLKRIDGGGPPARPVRRRAT